MKKSTDRWLRLRPGMLSVLIFISFLPLVADAQAARSHALKGQSEMQTFSANVLYTFGEPPNPINPVGLVADGAGNFYGATYEGGSGHCTFGCGSVFELSPNGSGGWTYNTIYNLQDGIDGGLPSSLSIDGQGNLYGSTVWGDGSIIGAVFELSREPDGTWILTNAYDFTGTADGGSPSGVVVDSSGNVYGTSYSGIYGPLIFELQSVDSQWIEKGLYSFTSNSTATLDGVVIDRKGDLYGVADGGIWGSPQQNGFVYKLHNSAKRGWVLTTLYTFQGGPSDGATPDGMLTMDKAGNMYGTVFSGLAGYGGVYKLTPSGKITWLYAFTGMEDGGYPLNGVVFDKAGNLYGEAIGGPNPTCFFGTNCPLIFELMAPKNNGTSTWQEGTLYSFTSGKDGDGYQTPPLFDAASNLYGVSYDGGIGYGGSGFGTITELIPNPVQTTTTINKNAPNPSATAQAVTVAFTVAQSALANSKPTGTVTVNASTGEACVGAIRPNGYGICTVMFLSAGARTLTATYSGDANDQSSVSAPVTQTVMNQTRTKITNHSPDPGKVGHAVTVEFSVEATDGTNKTNPRGAVTVNASTGESCSGTIGAAGNGKCQITFASTGVRTLVATYPGDTDNNGSVSTAVEQSVE
jgi:hypothetical protein